MDDEDAGWGRQQALLQLKEQRELGESGGMRCPQRAGKFPSCKGTEKLSPSHKDTNKAVMTGLY